MTTRNLACSDAQQQNCTHHIHNHACVWPLPQDIHGAFTVRANKLPEAAQRLRAQQVCWLSCAKLFRNLSLKGGLDHRRIPIGHGGTKTRGEGGGRPVEGLLVSTSRQNGLHPPRTPRSQPETIQFRDTILTSSARSCSCGDGESVCAGQAQGTHSLCAADSRASSASPAAIF